MAKADLPQIKDAAVAQADTEIAEKEAAIDAYLEGTLFGWDGVFRADRCNTAELEAIAKNAGKKDTVAMSKKVKDEIVRSGDQDLVDFVLGKYEKASKDDVKTLVEVAKAEIARRA